MTVNEFSRQVHRLHQLTVYGRWLFVAGCWLTLAPIALWELREDITLLKQFFTWTSLKYALSYHFGASLGLVFCISITGAVLTWQGRNLLLGLPEREKRKLEQKVREIRSAGPKHPLWRWVVAK